MSRLLSLLCLVAVKPAIGFRARHKATDTSGAVALHTRAADCQALGNITVGGHDIGQAAALLCQFWPAQFGEFPVKNAQTVAALFDKAGDLWEKIRELAKGRPGGSPFCWKKTGTRETLQRLLLDSKLSFKSNDLATLSNCEMTIGGTCYGDCPIGMKPMTLVGGFAPVCTSECSHTDEHNTPCGFGCANGTWTCAKTLVDQVAQVTRTVGQVSSYLTGNPVISEVVDKVLRLAEFAVDTLFEVIRVAKHVFSEWPKEDAKLGVVMALLQFVLDNAKEIGQSFIHLKEEFGETLEMVLELVDMEFEWAELNLKFITDTILKHGSAILDSAFEFAEVFVFPACKVSDAPPPAPTPAPEDPCPWWCPLSFCLSSDCDGCTARFCLS